MEGITEQETTALSRHSYSDPAKERRKSPLSSCIRTSMELYFRDMDGHAPSNVYQMVLSEVEKPLLEVVMQFTRGNQTRAAEMLGINRSTLRKKLSQYNLNS